MSITLVVVSAFLFAFVDKSAIRLELKKSKISEFNIQFISFVLTLLRWQTKVDA